MIPPFITSYLSLLLCIVFFFLSSRPCTSARTIAKTTLDVASTLRRIEHYGDKWKNIDTLLDLGRDETNKAVNGVSEIKTYLQRFGYLPLSSKNDVTDDVFDDRFESALKRYQEQFGLRVTGKLDHDTLTQIVAPRCGVSDGVYKDNLHEAKHFVYFPGKPRWLRRIPMTLTYSFSPDYMIHYLSTNDMKDAFKRAF